MREFSNGWTRLCGLLPCSGSQASAVLAELEHFINLRIVAILKVFAELRVLVHCPLNAAVVVGLVVYQLQDVGGHIFENDREENLIGQSQVPGRVRGLSFLQDLWATGPFLSTIHHIYICAYVFISMHIYIC